LWDTKLSKIIKIVDTSCQILRLKCTKFNFGWSFAHAKHRWGSLQPSLRGGKGKRGRRVGSKGKKRGWREEGK